MYGTASAGGCPSGQRERAVNPSAKPSEVRILFPPLRPPPALIAVRAASRPPRTTPPTPRCRVDVDADHLARRHGVGQAPSDGARTAATVEEAHPRPQMGEEEGGVAGRRPAGVAGV